MPSDPFPLNYEPKTREQRKLVRDDVAYWLPMLVFMLFVWLGTKGEDTGHGNTWYPWAYLARVVVVAAMLIAFRHAYTKIRWNHWWLTAIGWGFMVGGLLAYTKSLGACIIAHATTNLLLGVYVLYSKQWSLW